jgi:SAM-dependent methyltransferase
VNLQGPGQFAVGAAKFRRAGEHPLELLLGLDFSSGAFGFLSRWGGHYDKIVLANAEQLPFEDGAVDTALAVETLEHLWPDDVVGAIEELIRVSKAEVIITSPFPYDVVNPGWLAREIEAARCDPVPMVYEEYCLLLGAIHKSALEPSDMKKAGFRVISIDGALATSALYMGKSAEIDVSAIALPCGIRAQEAKVGLPDYRDSYLELLAAALEMKKIFRRVPSRVRISRAILRQVTVAGFPDFSGKGASGP